MEETNPRNSIQRSPGKTMIEVATPRTEATSVATPEEAIEPRIQNPQIHGGRRTRIRKKHGRQIASPGRKMEGNPTNLSAPKANSV